VISPLARLRPAFTSVLVTVALAGLARHAWAGDEGCVTCHADEDMDEPYRKPALAFAKDVHAKAGLSCTVCHGGVDGTLDYVEAHDKAKGFRGAVPAGEVVSLCAGCHDDAARMKSLGGSVPETPPGAAFRGSVHGRVHPVEGFELPTCISCHGAHGILPPSDPASSVHPTHVPETCARCHQDLDTMRAFTSALVRVDQLIEYRTSVHGKRLAEGDTKVAVCSSCHGHHAILPASDPQSKVYPTRVAETCGACHADPKRMAGYKGLSTSQLHDYEQSVHYRALVEKGDLSAPTCNDCHGNHGATPPQVRAVENICGQCHTRPAELLAGTALESELRKEKLPGCVTCHGNHAVTRPDDELLDRVAAGTTPLGWKPGEPWKGTALTLRADIRRLDDRLREVRALVDEVAGYGMDMTQARLRLRQAQDQLLQARVSVHAFDTGVMRGILEGTQDELGGLELARRAETLAQEGLHERAFRRVGLAVALGLILLLIVLLLLKIRRLGPPDALHPQGSGPMRVGGQ